MKKVFVNGYGSIGSRIAQFIKDDSELEVIGVGKYSPDEKVNMAISRGFSVYVPEKKQDLFKNYKIAIGKKHVMQGSCNVTGMGRILQPLREKYNERLLRFDVILVRRWADLEQTDKEVKKINNKKKKTKKKKYIIKKKKKNVFVFFIF